MRTFPTAPDGSPLPPVGHRRTRPPADVILAAMDVDARRSLTALLGALTGRAAVGDGTLAWTVDTVTDTCDITGVGPIHTSWVDIHLTDSVEGQNWQWTVTAGRTATTDQATWDDTLECHRAVRLHTCAFTFDDPTNLGIDPDVDVWTVRSIGRTGADVTVVTGVGQLPTAAQYAHLAAAAGDDGRYTCQPGWHPETISDALTEWAAHFGTDVTFTYEPDGPPSPMLATALLRSAAIDSGDAEPLATIRLRHDDQPDTTVPPDGGCDSCLLGIPSGWYLAATDDGTATRTVGLCVDCAAGHPAA